MGSSSRALVRVAGPLRSEHALAEEKRKPPTKAEGRRRQPGPPTTTRCASLLGEAVHPVPVRRRGDPPEYCDSLKQHPRWPVVGSKSHALQEPLLSGVPILSPVRFEPIDIEISH